MSPSVTTNHSQVEVVLSRIVMERAENGKNKGKEGMRNENRRQREARKTPRDENLKAQISPPKIRHLGIKNIFGKFYTFDHFRVFW